MILGPYKDWAATSGLILRHGYIVAEWGDTRRVDMTFSVAKSYLSTVAGLAFDRGLIPDVNRPVRELVRDGGFDSDHNAQITWHQWNRPLPEVFAEMVMDSIGASDTWRCTATTIRTSKPAGGRCSR